MSTAKYIRWFAEIRNEDVASVGGKNASLGEMYQDLTKVGVKIPNGFALTADAYWQVVKTGDVLMGSGIPWPGSIRPALLISKAGEKKYGT